MVHDQLVVRCDSKVQLVLRCSFDIAGVRSGLGFSWW